MTKLMTATEVRKLEEKARDRFIDVYTMVSKVAGEELIKETEEGIKEMLDKYMKEMDSTLSDIKNDMLEYAESYVFYKYPHILKKE